MFHSVGLHSDALVSDISSAEVNADGGSSFFSSFAEGRGEILNDIFLKGRISFCCKSSFFILCEISVDSCNFSVSVFISDILASSLQLRLSSRTVSWEVGSLSQLASPLLILIFCLLK